MSTSIHSGQSSVTHNDVSRPNPFHEISLSTLPNREVARVEIAVAALDKLYAAATSDPTEKMLGVQAQHTAENLASFRSTLMTLIEPIYPETGVTPKGTTRPISRTDFLIRFAQDPIQSDLMSVVEQIDPNVGTVLLNALSRIDNNGREFITPLLDNPITPGNDRTVTIWP